MRSQRRLAALPVLGGAVAVLLAVLLNVPIAGLNTASPGGSDLVIGSPLLGKTAPDFTLTTLEGTSVHLSDYRGRPVIVNFWASWCIPCREEFPQFVAARAQHTTERLEVLGIVHQDSADAAAAFARDHGAEWPLLLDPQDVAWKAYLGLGVPSTYFIDRNGVVQATSLGPVTATALPIQLAKIL